MEIQSRYINSGKDRKILSNKVTTKIQFLEKEIQKWVEKPEFQKKIITDQQLTVTSSFPLSSSATAGPIRSQDESRRYCTCTEKTQSTCNSETNNTDQNERKNSHLPSILTGGEKIYTKHYE